eukprot:s1_g1786.t1
MPVLAGCTEPLADGVVDMRGLWLAETGAVGHVERIEQCGNRTVVTSSGIIHDFHTDGTLANGSRDIEPPRCINTLVSIAFNDEGVMEFSPFGLPASRPISRISPAGLVLFVKRRREGQIVQTDAAHFQEPINAGEDHGRRSRGDEELAQDLRTHRRARRRALLDIAHFFLSDDAKRQHDKKRQPPDNGIGGDAADERHGRLSLFQFDQGAEKVFWVQEDDRLAMGADARLARSGDGDTMVGHLFTSCVNVFNLDADVVNATLGILGQEASDGRIVAQRLQQLQFGVAQINKDRRYPVIGLRHLPRNFGTEFNLVHFSRFGDVWYRNGDVI